jgi:hypothetical protein
MRRITKIAVAVAVAVVIAPTAAQAADGNVYAYEHINFGGAVCAWSGNDTDWGSCSPGGTMLNRASSLWNNGYAGGNDEVNFYWGQSYTGAWDCLGVGDAWSNLTNQRFIYGSGRPGHGQSTNDNIASHKWVSFCGQS